MAEGLCLKWLEDPRAANATNVGDRIGHERLHPAYIATVFAVKKGEIGMVEEDRSVGSRRLRLLLYSRIVSTILVLVHYSHFTIEPSIW